MQQAQWRHLSDQFPFPRSSMFQQNVVKSHAVLWPLYKTRWFDNYTPMQRTR